MTIEEARTKAGENATRMRVAYVIIAAQTWFAGLDYRTIRASSWETLRPVFPELTCVETVSPMVQ